MRLLGSRPLAVICWLAGAAILAFSAWWVCYTPNCASTKMDAIVMQWFAHRRNETADRFFLAVTWLGSILVLVPLVIASMWRLKIHRHIRESYFLGASLLGAMTIMHISKFFVARPRPVDVSTLVAMPWDQSFPSAHTAQVASVMLGALFVAGRVNRAWLKWLLPLAVLLVVLVAASRIYLQVHYTSDVLVGFFVGALWVAGLACWMFPHEKARLEHNAQ